MTHFNKWQARTFPILLAAILTLVFGRQADLQTQETEAAFPGEGPLQTFVVTSTSDSGAGSLRQAIADANASPGLDMITFNIAGPGIRSIFISTVLPTITGPVIIDGTTQPGYAGSPLIAIRAQLATQALNITSGGTTVKGMSFTGFFGTTSNIITLSGPGNNRVSACYFGILGDLTRPSMTANSLVIDASNNNLIGGSSAADRNYFESDSGYHVIIRNAAANNRVAGNWFGTGPTGNRLVLQREPVRIESAPNNIIGGSVGTTPGGACTGECNVITGNQNGHGIYILGSASTGNRVLGNFIGVFADGMTRNQNSNDGIKIDNAPGNFVGGTTAGERNVIAGNTVNEIEVIGAGSTGNVISGNYIGILTDGVTTFSANSSAFIGISLGGSSSSTRIGGVTAGERNIVSGSRNGMSISAPGTVIQGNYVGTNAAGTAASTTVGSGIGISSNDNIIGGTLGTTLGGACTGACNVISGNGMDGLSHGIILVGASGNTIDGNYIGLNAAGTAALPNGLNGSTFQGNAIALFNSTNNTIGHTVGASMPELGQHSEDRDEETGSDVPYTTYCFRDEATGDYITVDDTTRRYTGKHCRSGSMFSGRVNNFGVGFISEQGDPVYMLAVPSNGSDEGRATLQFERADGNIGSINGTQFNGSCTCGNNGVQHIEGTIELTDQSNTNFLKYMLLNKDIFGNDLPDLQQPKSPILIANGSGNEVSDTDITSFRLPALSILEGDHNYYLKMKMDQLISGQPVDIAPGANGDIELSSLEIHPLSNGDIEISGTANGLPANANVIVKFYASDSEIGSNRFSDAGLQVEGQADGAGHLNFLAHFSGPLAEIIDKFEYISATVTVLMGTPPVPGDTSELSSRTFIPKARSDWDHDGKDDVAVFRPNPVTGLPSIFYILNSHDNSFTFQQFGSGGDLLTTGDYNGDHLTDLSVWRPSTSTFYIADPTGDPATHFTAVPWGLSSDVPVSVDRDGDGRVDVGVFRPSNGIWYFRNSLGGDLFAQQWGLGTDKLVPGDFNGDGHSDLGVYRGGIWYVSFCPGCPPISIPFGLSTDTPTPADFDGDGITDFAVFRPETGIWYVQASAIGFFARQWGRNGDDPLNGDFDGDGKKDIGVWRPEDGNFYILQSGTGTPFVVHWGQAGDIPVPSFLAENH